MVHTTNMIGLCDPHIAHASAHHAVAQATHPIAVAAIRTRTSEVCTRGSTAAKLMVAVADPCEIPHSKQAGEGVRAGEVGRLTSRREHPIACHGVV